MDIDTIISTATALDAATVTRFEDFIATVEIDGRALGVERVVGAFGVERIRLGRMIRDDEGDWVDESISVGVSDEDDDPVALFLDAGTAKAAVDAWIISGVLAEGVSDEQIEAAAQEAARPA